MRPLQAWSAAPRRLMWSFLLLLLLPASAVGWLGVRFIEQDRQLEAKQVLERRANAADLVVADLERAVSATDLRLARSPAELPLHPDDDAVVVRMGDAGVDVTPRARVFYIPEPTAFATDSTDHFAGAEALELRANDFAAAAAAYRAMARSANGDRRAGALVRLARTLKKMRRSDEALAAYDEVAALTAARVWDLPADLVSRRAKAALLAELGRRDDLLREVRTLRADLLGSRWLLSRGTFEAYVHQVDGWLQSAAALEASRLALSEAVDWLWRERGRAGFPPSGRQALRLQDLDVTVLWSSQTNRLTALVAGPSFVRRHWTASLLTSLQERGLDLALTATDAQAGARSAPTHDSSLVRRGATQTGLPWTVTVRDHAGAADVAGRSSRRRTVAAGLALILLVVVAGACLMARSVARELAVARLQSDFVSAVSHEFRTPLTSLHQFTALLNDDVEPPAAKRRTFYQAQARATERLERLVESLLDFGRMEAGARPYRLEHLRAAELVRDVVSDFSRDSLPEGFNVECSGGDEPAVVHVDREAIGRALRNLLENAVKYSGDARRIVVQIARRGDQLAMSVSDQGLGIPRDEQRQIFDKFVRGSASRRLGLKGTGIGLSMVRHIAHAHRGRITVESSPGQGSTFTIWLPLDTPSAAETHIVRHPDVALRK